MELESAAAPTLHIGVIGAGRIVERAHLPLLSSLPGVAVDGLFDPDEAQARALAQRFGVPNVCRNLDELVRLSLDAVIVACPNYLHAPISIAALEARLHVLCEKPMAVSSAEAEAMCAAAERAGCELMIAFPNRFRPEVIALHELIQQGQLGKVKAVRCGWLRRNGVPGVGTWFTNRAQAGGGVLSDLGSHMIDLALWLGGQHELLATCCVLDRAIAAQSQARWYARASAPDDGVCDVETSASGFAVFTGPLDIFVEVSWDCAVPHDQTYLHVVGERGIARLETLFGFSPTTDRPEHPLQLWIDGQPIAHAATTTADLLQPYRDQLRFFIASLRARRSLRPALRESLATVRVIEAMYRSAEQLASGAAGS